MAHVTDADAPVAVVAGAGPGLGASLARRFAREGCRVAPFARSAEYVTELADDLPDPGEGLGVRVDLADPASIDEGFERVRDAFGPVDLLVNHASAAPWEGLLDCETRDLDDALDVGVRGAFRCSQAAVSDMLDTGGGTVIFTGATTSVRGREGAVAFSAAKFGARGLAESMARELGPEGVHVAHVVIDGGIRPPDREVDDPEAYLDPDAIADAYWNLATQDRSAWTLELDLRPHVEAF
jgi:NAD(P)-dependent dehydrogenase (short-subunit alcohol dehydrogenase family)